MVDRKLANIEEKDVRMGPLHQTLHRRVEFAGEEAEDRGGVKKEFFMLLFERILQPEYGIPGIGSQFAIVCLTLRLL